MEKGTADTTFIREVSAIYSGPNRAHTKIRGPESAVEFIRKILPDNSREHFVALYLDGAHQVAAYSVVATGTANSCQVHPREIFQMAILAGAVSLLVGHNHPSGETSPSQQDKNITTILREAGVLVGIKLIDHVIVGHDAFHSFSEASEL